MDYADKVAKTLSQFERGLLTEKDYLSEVLFLAQAEVDSRKLYKVTLAWPEVGRMRVIAYCETEMALVTLIDDYVESYNLNAYYNIIHTGGGYTMVCVDGDTKPCTIVVDKQR